MFKEGQLWQVHTEGSARGSYAASLEVSPPPAGAVLLLILCSAISVPPQSLCRHAITM